MSKSTLASIIEISLIVLAAVALGGIWNRTLLADAWRGAPTSQPSPAQASEVLPMPVGLAQVKEMLDSGQAVVVDARSATSFREGHIAGALPFPLEEAKQRQGKSPMLAKVSKDSVIIAYCNGFSCHDSTELAKLLIGAGYGSVYVFEGGLPEWRDAGYPVARGER
jgi:rhodanese-related sulfurtransferase